MSQDSFFVPNPTLPDCKDVPFLFSKQPSGSSVSRSVFFDLLRPEKRIGLRNFGPGAIRMSVPKASVDENDGFSGRNNEIRLSRK